MKYIRTRHEIEQLEQGKTYNGLEIIAQADTIEELIDGWVVRRYVMDEPCHWFYTTKEKMKADISLRNSAYTIFGAIWTDKGLIYVAKMNDKGELELL